MEIEYANDWHVDRNDNDHGGKICFSASLVAKKGSTLGSSPSKNVMSTFCTTARHRFTFYRAYIHFKLKLSINVNVNRYLNCLVG